MLELKTPDAFTIGASHSRGKANCEVAASGDVTPSLTVSVSLPFIPLIWKRSAPVTFVKAATSAVRSMLAFASLNKIVSVPLPPLIVSAEVRLVVVAIVKVSLPHHHQHFQR